ncbi:hypothetical protein GP486_006165 [Trichoglossum hirsutum]|uniref:Transmembrane protein n=1 Tax=Trichoglossum hirsutum TaxID=265104 RepID=A0A9P8L7V3_9PEZI|nr:hypothetical protein GP486_006165 [Trichoglossum hirsutum]
MVDSTLTSVVTSSGLVHYDRPATKRNITATTTRGGFALKTPLTDRQPLFTAVNAFFEAQRNHWLDFFKLPVYVSVSWSSEPVSLLQLDNPVSATEVPSTGDARAMKKLSEEDVTAFPTIWGATTTTTITTIITAVPGDVVYLQFPTQTSSPALQYTTISSVPDDPNSKLFPNGLPILVLTQLNGIVVNPQNQTLTTVSTVQAAPQPLSSDIDGRKVNYSPPSSGWPSWSTAEKGGVVAAAVFAGLLLVVVCAYVCMTEHSRGKVKDTEKGANGEENPKPRFSFSRGIPGAFKLTASKTVDKKGKAAVGMGMGRLQRSTDSVKDKKTSGIGGGTASGNTSLHSTQRSQHVEQKLLQGTSGVAPGPSNT